MAKKILDNISMGQTWTTYIGCAEGVLKKAGFWQGDRFELMGMTGMAFHFIIHKNACPSSVTVYDWCDEHFSMMDRIGVFTRCISPMKNYNTSGLILEDAVSAIKTSIDRGIPAVAWAPARILEFGIIKGYDDESRVFYSMDCTDENPDPLLYENLGKSEVPILFVQLFLSRSDVSPEKIYRDSLQYGIDHWKKPVEADPDYACGKNAYNYLLNTLEKGDYNGFGLSYIIAVYADAKSHLFRYLKDIKQKSRTVKISSKLIDLYEKIDEKFRNAGVLVPFRGPGVNEVDKKNIPALIALFRECRDLETDAMNEIEKAVAV